jgi:hypothetical protein
MKLSQSVQVIGNLLTNIDTTLARDEFHSSDPSWQQLYALRKHLDDQQRTLVKLSPSAEKVRRAEDFTRSASEANNLLSGYHSTSSLNDAIGRVAMVTAEVHQFIQYVEPGPDD